MIIHQLQIENFKSYNGFHSFGPFDQHFTCVIGPNGNGKSNIIDAVLFVFGFKSSKLRQDNLSSLIHKSAFAKPEQATVTVIFKQESQFIKVSRTIFKSGHSYYRHNGEKIGWTELRQKLISKKIDLNKNLFIILQGQVQRLCELSPQKMVQYLQYVSGSDQFKEIIDEAEKKYIQKSICKQEVRASLSVKRKIFENIKQRAGGQATWIMLRVKVMLFQHLVLKKIFIDNHTTLQQLLDSEKQQILACEKIEADIRLNQQKIYEKKGELKLINAQYSKGQAFMQRIQQKIDGLSLKIKQANRQINFMIKDKDKKQAQKQRVVAQINQLDKISKQQQEFIHRYNQINSLTKQYSEINKLRICYDLQEKIKELKSANEELSIKYTQDKARLQADKQKLKIYQLKYKQNKQFIIKCRKDLKLISEQIDEITISISENEEALVQIQRQIGQKPNEKIVSNQQKILNQIRSANKLKALCSDIVLVTLRQLIIIDPTYADVVQTILPHLDFFIVDNIKQAKEILDYLNKRKLGRMTILIRQSINEATQDIKLISCAPKQTKLLYEVCKCTDEQTKKILVWALGNTLVTNKLDIAMKVAYYDERRFRVITTNGEFIDTSGTITKLPLKNGKDKYNQQHLIKKEATIKKTIASHGERKKELQKKKDEVQISLLNVENEERSLDGLDEVFLQDLQVQIKESMEKSAKYQKEIAVLNESLDKLINKIKSSGFNMKYYSDALLLLKQQKQNESKVKKIQNSKNIHISLQSRKEQILRCISKMNETVQQKVKQKSTLQTQSLKYQQSIQQKNKQFEVIKYAIQLIQQQIKNIQGVKKSLTDQLSDSNKKNTFLPQPREELKKIRFKIKNAQMEKLQLLSKLFQSIKQIKQFSFIIDKALLSKCPELITKPTNSPTQQPVQITKSSIIEQNILVLGKNQYKFNMFLNQKEEWLLAGKIKHNGSIYCQINDIRPSNPDADLIFEALPSKQAKFGHSFEMEKIKHFQKELTKSQSTEYQVDFQLFDEYVQKKKQFQTQAQELNIINKEVEVIKNELIQLRNKRLSIFMKSFNEINIELNKIYMQLTGGRAEINLLDSMNPFQGIEFSVRPVNKSWKRVNLLSGGEKTFTSLALIFACQEIKKFPFYFMDEIDAALDYKNTTLLAQYITSKKATQHIVISLRKNMYQECNRVIGVYKIKDQSRIVEMNMSEIKQRENE